MELFDTHCHLDLLTQTENFYDKFGSALPELLSDHKVVHLTQIGTNLESSRFASVLPSIIKDGKNPAEGSYDFSKAYQSTIDYFLNNRLPVMAHYSIGLHPCSHAEYASAGAILELAEEKKSDPDFVAVGEIGLDFYWESEPEVKERQTELFIRFLTAAKKLNRPVVVHSRDAFEETYACLKEHHDGNGIIHCFTGDAHWARKFSELGYHISFSGIVTFKNATDIREAAEITPLDKLLVETDAPYLAPVPKRGKTNNPAYVYHTAEFIAKLRGIDFSDFASITMQNALKLFQLENKK